MGLDMYAFSAKRDQLVNPDALISLELHKGVSRMEFAYWRKFNALHGWMEDLYRARGGDGDFNCESVQLTAQDLDALEKALDDNALKPRSGFFWGAQEIYPEDVESTREFIAKAREELADDKIVYYYSWW